MPNRCQDCNKFVGLDYNSDYDQVSLEVSEDGDVTAEYSFNLDCAECGTTLRTGTLEFDLNDIDPAITDYLSDPTEEVVDAARAKAVEDYYIEKEAAGWPRSQVEAETTEKEWEQMQENAELALYTRNFKVEETSVEVEDKKISGRKAWEMTITALVTDEDNSAWEGVELTLVNNMFDAELEEC